MSRRSKTTMYPLIKSWEQSSQSKAAFCEQHGINIHTFTYWVQKYRAEGQQPKASDENFIPLNIDNNIVIPGKGVVELRYPNGVWLSFSHLVDVQYLESLIGLTV